MGATLRPLGRRVCDTHPIVTRNPVLGNRLGCLFLALLGVGPAAAAGDSEYLPGTPFTYLFDAGSQAARPLSAKAIAAKQGWALVPEDDTEHAFQGDAVLLNDKLTLVLRRRGPGAEVYSQTADGPKLRAVVMSAPRKAVAITGASSIRIVENSLGAVMVEADFHGDGQSGTCTAGYRLTPGQSMLEMTGGQAADRFFAWSNTRYVVVPDFFADDMVFSASACDLPRFGLPAENFLLNLIDGGDCLLACVWRSAEQEAYAVATGDGADRAIRGCEIGGGADKILWVALLEQPDIWCHRTIADDDAAGPIHLDWKPPFDARWRADFVRSDGGADSRALPDVLAPSGPTESTSLVPGMPSGRVVVYPIDRSPDTPLTALCPIDVLRNTLGVGPCQYVLQSEGLASDTNPTPAFVMEWVEKQFAGDKEAESADEIGRRLDAMADHVAHVQARIDQYAAFSHQIRALCESSGENTEPAAIERFTDVLDEMDRSLAALRDTTDAPASATALARRIAGLIGKENASAECGRLGEDVRRIGAAQDRTLSKCRMAVRWLKQQARMTAISSPRAAELAREIRARTERFIEGQ